MNSFDVFDTLLARRFVTSDPLWDHMERTTGIAGFKAARVGADTGSRSLDEIYQALVDSGLITSNEKPVLMKQEIDLEMSTAIPVRKNLDRVAHGDILISDMYLPAYAILKMVRAAGLDKQVTLYQSNGDKRNGSVWGKFKTVRPAVHLGDNKHSDYDSPNAAGFTGEWFNPATEMTDAEKIIATNRLPHLSLLMREIRLGRNMGSEYFDLACSANIPLLFIIAEWLSRTVETPIVFLGRDCFLLEKIFSAFYQPSCYLPFSRKIAYSQVDDARTYLKVHCPSDATLFDISSTGATWAMIASNFPVKVALYSDVYYYTTEKPTLLPHNFSWLAKNSEIGKTNLVLELLNCADHGHLSSLDVQEGALMKANFDQPELPSNVIEAVHAPVLDALRLTQQYKTPVRGELGSLDGETLQGLMKVLLASITSRTDLAKAAEGFLDKEDSYLKDITP
jgi:hypothetical protein